MYALNRKLWRDLWRMRTQGLAIALVIAAGVAMYIMALGTVAALDDTRAAYYERYRFADVFAPVKRAPERVAERIRAIPGVRAVETRVVEEVTLTVPGFDEPVVGRVQSLPDSGRPALNEVVLRKGRFLAPDRPHEVLVSELFAEAHKLEPGDRLTAILNGHKRTLDIVGIVLSPEHIYAIPPGAFMPDDRHYGILWIGRDALAAAYDLDDAFNEVTVSLLPGASQADVIARLDRLLARYGGVGAYGREDHLSDKNLASELTQLRNMGTVAPFIFLAVAAFLLNIVVSRLIATEREQIGLLKAFGYGDIEVGWHYLKLVLTIAGIGILIGYVSGMVLARELTELYTRFFHFPFLYYRPTTGVFAVATLIAVAAAVIGTLFAVRRAVVLPPAAAMRPAAPPVYRRSLVERAGLSVLIPTSARMVIRHVLRWPRRAAVTVIGIAMAVAVLIDAMFMVDSTDFLIDIVFFHAQRQDVTVTFVEPQSRRAMYEIARMPGVLAVQPFRTVPVRLRAGQRTYRGAIEGVAEGADINRPLDVETRPLSMPDEGLVLSAKLAERLGVGRGDKVEVQALEGRRPVREVPVSALAQAFMGMPAYMEIEAVNRLMEEGPRLSGVYLRVDAAVVDRLYRDLEETPHVAKVTLQKASYRAFRDTISENMLIMTSFSIGFATLVAFGVVYNSARISLSERARELASLRVLGFTRLEVASILLGGAGAADRRCLADRVCVRLWPVLAYLGFARYRTLPHTVGGRSGDLWCGDTRGIAVGADIGTGGATSARPN